ncbi:hypothetical protein [Rufibacter tibetensis]|uniref:Lipoprotein n=1 Tax=Rufibacter tibetensis TaxID=512763 RepID=A0A0P0CEL1_9BACT|nr:hypothetical protein [Rufibacter tibetensis]ALJ00278.1 hypothetical protein DC20_16500 [Rufibacter tibetensis]
MKNNLILILLLLVGCSPIRIEKEHISIENVALVEYTYRENEERSGYNFYLASIHQLSSDGNVSLVRRDKFNAPLRTYTSTAKNLTGSLTELLLKYPSDTSLLVFDTKGTELSHGFLYMLLLTDAKGKETVVSFAPSEAEGALKLVSDSLLRHKIAEEMRTAAVDTASLIAAFDSIVRKHVLPLHPLPPNSLPPPVYTGQKE